MIALYCTTPILPDSEEAFRVGLTALPEALHPYACLAKPGEGRARRLAALTALAGLLSRQGVAPSPIAVGPYGKPDLSDGRYHVSFSHAGGLAAAVLADGCVGIDLEPYDTPLPEARIARLASRFSAGERALLAAAPDRAHAFLEIWVRKEALMKKGGRGLADLAAADTAACEPYADERPFHAGREYYLAIY